MSDDPAGRPTERSGRALVVAAAVAAALFLAYLVLGMPGMDHDPSGNTGSMDSMDHAAMADEGLSVGDFRSRMAQGAFVVNVHRPYDGEIEGTDASIPYDEIAGDRSVPSDKGTPILLYCRTGRMSAVAADSLVSAGYTDVAHLRGGMDAWEAAGMPVLRRQF